MKIVYFREGIRTFSGPDHWNDFDMLEVGNGMTESEDRAHFSM
jgi:alpha-galactosidase